MTAKWEKAKVGCYWYFGTSVISTVSCGPWRGYRLVIRCTHAGDYLTLRQAQEAHSRLVNPYPRVRISPC
jgi:hypothetical protein